MAKFDFFNNDYDLEEIIDGLTDGDIANFKNDEDFLTFLIYYAFHVNLNEDVGEELQEKYDGFSNSVDIMVLDEYDIRGEKLYQIYEICGKDKIKFIRTLFHIRKLGTGGFSKEEILTNLALEHPVDFIDETIMLPNDTNPKDIIQKNFMRIYNTGNDTIAHYSHDLRYSLIKRINAQIKKEGNKLGLLPEIKTYEQEQKELDDEITLNTVPDEYAIDINNVFYGKYTHDVGGGIINLNFALVSYFEHMNMRFGNYFVFRSVPSGDYCLIDEKGEIYIPDKTVEVNGISILPTTSIKYVKIASVKHILEECLKYLDPVKDEEDYLDVAGLLELLDNNTTITVAELKEYETVIRKCYEIAFGPMFERESDTPKL